MLLFLTTNMAVVTSLANQQLDFASNSTDIAQIASSIHLNIVLHDVIVFVVLQCFILLREAFRFTLNFGLKKRYFGRIRLLSIFSKTNRYSAKRTMQ